MPVTIRLRDNQIAVLQQETEGRPYVLINLVKTHRIWRTQSNYRQIRVDNDAYEAGNQPGGGIIHIIPILSVDKHVRLFAKLALKLAGLPPIFVGFTGGRHRTDYFYRQGARVFPVHYNSAHVGQAIQEFLGADQDLIAESVVL